MDKPDSVALPISDELWQKIKDHCSPEDLDDVIQFITGTINAYRDPWDYDSPWD